MSIKLICSCLSYTRKKNHLSAYRYSRFRRRCDRTSFETSASYTSRWGLTSKQRWFVSLCTCSCFCSCFFFT